MPWAHGGSNSWEKPVGSCGAVENIPSLCCAEVDVWDLSALATEWWGINCEWSTNNMQPNIKWNAETDQTLQH